MFIILLLKMCKICMTSYRYIQPLLSVWFQDLPWMPKSVDAQVRDIKKPVCNVSACNVCTSSSTSNCLYITYNYLIQYKCYVISCQSILFRE